MTYTVRIMFKNTISIKQYDTYGTKHKAKYL